MVGVQGATRGVSMRVVVDKTLKGDPTLKLEQISEFFGKVKFKIMDTAKIRLE